MTKISAKIKCAASPLRRGPIMAAYYFDQNDDSYDRDCPLICSWTAPGMAEALGLLAPPNDSYGQMRDMVLANLWLAAEGEKALSYSRHEPFYKRSRYRPPTFTYTTIVRRIVPEII